MATSNYENGINLDFWGYDEDLWEIVEMFQVANQNDPDTYAVHRVSDDSCDRFDFYLGKNYDGSPDVTRNMTLGDLSQACVKWVFSERPDLFPTFMAKGATWRNGGNMTPEIADEIIRFMLL